MQFADSNVQNALHMMLDSISTFDTMDEFVQRILLDATDVLPSAHERRAETMHQDSLKNIQLESPNETICEKADLAYDIISKIPAIRNHFDEPSKILALKMLIMRFIRISRLQKCKINTKSKC